MKSFALLLVFTLIATSCSKNKTRFPSSDNFDLVKLTDGVYACIHKFGGKAICNVGIIDNGKETLIFDTFLSPSVAEELLDVVDKLGMSPIKYVVNSHAHNDHIRGNQVFSPGVKIISTSKSAELIKEWEAVNLKEEKEYAPQYFAHYDSLFANFRGDTASREYKNILMWRPYYEILAESFEVVQTRLPDIYVDHEQSFNGPDRSLQIITRGSAHTESDLILYLPDDQILFSGDIIFNACHPYMAHGSIPDWKNYLEFLDSLDITILIPGHGQPGSKQLIQSMKSYILSIEELAEKMHQEGLYMEDSENIEIPEPYKAWWFERFFPSNLNFAYRMQKPGS